MKRKVFESTANLLEGRGFWLILLSGSRSASHHRFPSRIALTCLAADGGTPTVPSLGFAKPSPANRESCLEAFVLLSTCREPRSRR